MKSSSLAILLPLAGIASAQFQFFDSMFGHPSQQQHHQQQRTGAAQYAALVDDGKSKPPITYLNMLKTICKSFLSRIPLPGHIRLCRESHLLSMSRRGGCEMHHP